ncbi:hypothetical protein L195_g063178, partial [Trifolium pratense]
MGFRVLVFEDVLDLELFSAGSGKSFEGRVRATVEAKEAVTFFKLDQEI